MGVLINVLQSPYQPFTNLGKFHQYPNYLHVIINNSAFLPNSRFNFYGIKNPDIASIILNVHIDMN